MADYSTVGIWTRCPRCADEAVAVVQFRSHQGDGARLLDFRCADECDVDEPAVLRRLRLPPLERAS